jgi:glycosyltransferase involved in cell wall biosynthesis
VPDEPLVDVGIPTVRSPQYLTEALDSVLAQTFTGWRLTVSDNGGGNAAEIVAPYLDDPRIAYRENTTILEGEFGALAGNWSSLITGATAPYVALLHDDDWWDPGFLERRVELLGRHPECGLVYGPHVDVDAAGVEIRRAQVPLEEGVYRPQEFVARFVRDKDLHPSPPSVLVRRDAYEAVGPQFNANFAMCDSEMWLRLALRFPVGFVAAHDAYYRVHGQSLSAAARWGESWIAYQEHVEQLLERQLPAVAFTPAESRRRRASAQLSSAMDAIAQRRRRAALGHLRAAARVDRTSVFDPRMALALAVLPFGARGARLLQRIRGTVVRRDLRVPFVRPH